MNEVKLNQRSKEQLIIKNHISKVKKLCQTNGIDYEIKPTSRQKPKISPEELKEAY
ncbi:MAG: hypothetical protein MRERC_1c170 [Mycoplasmataceae bacterium RC_NB112A]|nr:MAG: hypothetical protein MRERC_1c170 [Mycoplasmataceae bacterium RC_NB112A]